MANLDSMAMLAALDGVLLVDKPAQLSTHDLLKALKSRFNLSKVGHGGTLEPNATGLVVLLVGNATSMVNDVMGGDRAYRATIRLGCCTNTYDAEGDVLAERSFADVNQKLFENALPEFRGDIFQTPPPYSVIKRSDTPSYSIVPTSSEEAKARLVHVYRLAIMNFAPPLVELDLMCTKGVSVRTLAHDLGEQLGCGASLESLRRTRCAQFKLEDAMGFMELMKLDPVAFKHRLIPVAGAFD